MMSVLERARAASPETLHLDDIIGAADGWDVTSTLIYGKSEAMLVTHLGSPLEMQAKLNDAGLVPRSE
jgi:hypothetical protein